jgi:phage terminase large subunit GpA-like protein
MNKSLKDKFIDRFLGALQPFYTGSIADWTCNNVSLPNNYAVQGKFNIELSPYLKEPFASLDNKNIQQINLVAAVQTGKSLVAELYLPYIIVNSPGPVLKLHQTDDMASYFVNSRLLPLMENCKPIKELIDNSKRFAIKQTGFNLPHMYVKIGGAKENLLHGSTIRYLMMDEAWLYDSVDTITKAKARTAAFGKNRKVLITSQPGIEGDPLDKETKIGKIYQWGWTCPCCKNVQPWYWSREKEDGTWAGIVWDKVYVNEESSSYNFEATGDSARLQCYHCSASYNDTPETRKILNDGGSYLQTYDGGNSSVLTYNWCIFVNPKISFKEKCIEYLQATDTHKKMGLTDKLRIFRQQVMGETWKRNVTVDVSKVLVNNFTPDEAWPEEIFRCMSIDYQRKLGVKYWAVIAFSTNEMRIVDHGFCLKWDEIHELAEKYKIAPPAVAVDSGYNASEVYLESYNRGKVLKIGKKIERWGWTCLKGDDADEGYKHQMADGTKLIKYHSPMLRASIDNQRFARLYQWSNYAIKTILYHIRENKSEMKLVLPSPDPDFTKQLHAESLVEVMDQKTGLKKLRWEKHSDDNHYLDVCCQAIVMAMMANKFSPDGIPMLNSSAAIKK